jgi:hypothetical protein
MTRARAETLIDVLLLCVAHISFFRSFFVQCSLDWADFDSAMAGGRSAAGRRRQLREREDKVSTDLYICHDSVDPRGSPTVLK